MINLDKKGRKLILLQRNELLSNTQKYLRKRFGRYIFTNFLVNYFQAKDLNNLTTELFKKEFKIIEEHLPLNINNVLDIGCGLGIIHIFFKKKYKNNLKFFMLDKDKIDSSIKYGFNDNYESYNDLSETKNFLIKNNISEEQIVIQNVDNEINIADKIDLIISLKSMGYHYPVEKYLNLFKKNCHENTVFIFDVTTGKYNSNDINKFFSHSKVIYDEESLHPLKRLYCKGFKHLN